MLYISTLLFLAEFILIIQNDNQSITIIFRQYLKIEIFSWIITIVFLSQLHRKRYKFEIRCHFFSSFLSVCRDILSKPPNVIKITLSNVADMRYPPVCVPVIQKLLYSTHSSTTYLTESKTCFRAIFTFAQWLFAGNHFQEL